MKARRTLRIVVYFCLFIVLWFFVAIVLAENLVIEKPLDKADAILVLSGSHDYVERTDRAAAIYKQGVAPKIFLTDDNLRGGWNEKQQRNPFFVERARWHLIEQGVPEEAIEVLPTVVAGTIDEANLAIKTAQERNLKSLLLVTSNYHTRRTLWTFERAAHRTDLPIEIGIVSAPNERQSSSLIYWWTTVRGWRNIGGEYVKTIYYWLFY